MADKRRRTWRGNPQEALQLPGEGGLGIRRISNARDGDFEGPLAGVAKAVKHRIEPVLVTKAGSLEGLFARALVPQTIEDVKRALSVRDDVAADGQAQSGDIEPQIGRASCRERV